MNSSPFLPYPGKQTVFKRVTFAKKYGVAGGKQDGIDIKAEMDDGSILAVQCKDIQRYEPSKGISAMTKAEREFPEADAYFLVLTQEGIPKRLEREAERRGNWFVIGLSALSSWFFSGKFIDPESQKDLVSKHFGKAHLRALFPIPEDDFFVTPSQFFAKRNFISHEASLAGEEFQALRDRIVSSASGNGARVSIVIAPGGGGKTRLLKAVADSLATVPERKVRFQSDTANAQAEDYGIRGDMFLNSTTFIDDAHRLENVKPTVLRRIAGSSGATIVIGARPNSLESLKVILLKAGFVEDDWECDRLPSVDFKSRCTIARGAAPEVDDEVIHWLAEQSKDCVLVCTAGAELIKAGKFPDELIGTDDFKLKVFDHLLNSSLDGLYHGNSESLKRGELVIKILAMPGTIEDSELLNEKISEVMGCEPWDIDRIRHDLTTAGLLRVSRGRLRVIPDLLSDHLVYETGYGDGNGRLPALIKKVIDVFGTVAAGTLFGNLAEAEWRANQDGKSGSFLDPLWQKIREIFSDPENMKTFGLLDEWGKFAAFQPERTLKLAGIILDHEDLRIRSDILPQIYRGFRYDSISLQVGKLPDLLLPVVLHHPEQRMESLDLLWRVGQVKEGMVNDEKELPIAWKKMIQAGSLVYWQEGGPKDLFRWLKKWVATQEGCESLSNGHPFLSAVVSQWFRRNYGRSVKEATTIRNFSSEIGGFQKEVLQWLHEELVPKGVGHALVVARVLFANSAGPVMPSADPVSSLTPSFRKGLEILSGILSMVRRTTVTSCGLAVSFTRRNQSGR